MAARFSPANINEVDDVVKSDSEDLRAFIGSLLDMPEQRPNSQQIRTTLRPVVETFEAIAQAYLEKAKDLLGKEAAQPRLQKYEQVLSKVQNHALILSELVRPDPDKEFFPSSRRQLFNRLIATIASRTIVSGQPFILPVLADSFKYVHFNYVDGFGLLSLPPRMATMNASDRNLGIFWHEAAGYAIATAKRNHKPKFDYWSGMLHKRLRENHYWQQYSELYQQSLLTSLSGRDTFEKAGILEQIETLIRNNILSDPENVDGDGSWQLTWLSEFLEDLYWIIVGKDSDRPGLADGVINVLAGALAATYKDLRVGDPNHPPPHLRVLVAISFLCNGDLECINQRIAAFVGKDEDIFGLRQAAANRELAVVIATVCREILDQQVTAPWLYQTEVTDLERDVVSDILNDRPPWSRLPDANQGRNPTPNQDFIAEVHAVQDLDSLLAIEFTSNDPYPYGGASSLPPPWPPPELL